MNRLIAAVLSATLLLALSLAGHQARAQHTPSPRYGAFELKFGPYRPDIDSEPGVGSPYRDVFGNDNMFLTMIELDFQFLHLRGINFGIGGGMGFMQAYTPATTESGGESADYTVLNVMPFVLLGVVRVEVLDSELGIPLVPYFKGGLNWYLWWILGGGEVAKYVDEGDRSHRGSGGTPGWQISPGLAFRLDSFDRMSARTFDNELGVNHSSIFFEYTYAVVEGLFGGDHMYLSPKNMGRNGTWMIGLCLEF